MADGELAVVENNQIVDVEGALTEWENYQELTRRLLDANDYQQIGDRRFKKKQAWRKYMRAFNISTRVVDKEIIKDDRGRVTEASFIVRAWTPDGRESEGWGNCSHFERGFNKPNHDLPATAMTRATNRAISDLIGAGEVSAEEMGNEHNEQRKPASTMGKGKKPASARKPATTTSTKTNSTPKSVNPEAVEDAEVTSVIEGEARKWKELSKKNPALKKVLDNLNKTGLEFYDANIHAEAQELNDKGKITDKELDTIEVLTSYKAG